MQTLRQGQDTSDLHTVCMRSLYVPVLSNTVMTIHPHDRTLAVSHMMVQEYKKQFRYYV